MTYLVLLFALLLPACGTGGGAGGRDTARANKLGAITGIVRDQGTAISLVNVEVELAGRKAMSSSAGLYLFDDLRPGRYTLVAHYAGKTITVNNIEVVAGMASYADVAFPLGQVEPITINWGDAHESEIQRFTTSVPRIEGTVGDATSRARIPGAVVTAARGRDDETLQAVTDDDGRYRFDNVSPGTYAISAYYSVGGRAQIEVRRSDVTVGAGEGVLVPLWIEVAKQ